MKLEKQVCSFELAEKLKELGVKQDSIWYWESYLGSKEVSGRGLVLRKDRYIASCGYICYAAFTVAELGKLINEDLDECYFGGKYSLQYHFLIGKTMIIKSTKTCEGKNEANARAKMVVFLIKSGLIQP